MIFNGALADIEIHGNILAGMTGENHFHDFVLPMGEARETPVRGFLKAEQLAYQFVPRARQGTLRTLRALCSNTTLNEIPRCGAVRHAFSIYNRVR